MYEIKEIEGMGRGVVATQFMYPHTTIFVDPVVVLSKNETLLQEYCILGKYLFEWSKTKSAICFGHSSFINHSTEPNIAYELDKKSKEILFYSTQEIGRGEQLFIDYGYEVQVAEDVYNYYQKRLPKLLSQ